MLGPLLLCPQPDQNDPPGSRFLWCSLHSAASSSSCCHRICLLLYVHTYCGSSGTVRGMKMISCRTQYKSYRKKNTHIHTLNTCFTKRFFSSVRSVRTSRTYARCVSIDGGARLKGERSRYGSGSSVGLARACIYTISSSVQWWTI
jgi:hypothetical protein